MASVPPVITLKVEVDHEKVDALKAAHERYEKASTELREAAYALTGAMYDLNNGFVMTRQEET